MDIVAVLRGLVLNPLLVAFARGLLESAGMAAILFASDYIASDALPNEYKAFVPLGTLGLRMLEGIWDRVDPAKQRRRDALREEAVFAESPASKLEPGDVKDPAVEAAIESYNAGDYT